MKHINLYKTVLAIVALLLVSLACGSSTTEKLQEAVGDPGTTSETTTDPIDSEPITVIKYGFGQNGRSAGFAFIVENPNLGLSIEDSQYQLAAYDEDGIVVETDSGYINLLLPEQSIGIGGDLFLDEGVTISKIEVQLNSGDSAPTEPMTTFNVESTAYYAGDYFSHVTGVISSPYSIDFTDLRVSAIVYDEEGNIIGGGFTFLNFLLANGSSGTEVSVTSAGHVASVELYPTLSSLSLLSSDEERPDGTSDIQLVKFGFGQIDRSGGFGMLVENPNSGYAIERSQFQLTAFAANGTVLVTEEGYITSLLPEQLLGLGGDLIVGDGMEIDHIEVQIRAGKYVESEIISLS